jgi:dimethylamine/trimethylamine dehydrogenase
MILAGTPAAARILVYDCGGYLMGAGVAELLGGTGSKVTFVTPLEVAAPYLRTFEGYPVRARLHELGVNVLTETSLVQIEGGSCTTASYGREAEVQTDAVVLVTSRQSNDSLYHELLANRGDIRAIYATGDCVAPRQVADTVFDGHRLGREIDTLDPAILLPYLRERSVATVPSAH